MAKGSSTKRDGLFLAILAIIAGILILLKILPLYLIVGIYLIVYGILAIIRR